jgi:diaminohydroxyphosphoribosylaminopyrimidine deaminase/5-amino-6-(5-phosphoribosylamino)uracil reductase
MQRAVELAYRGLGYTRTNPMVGCVIVKNKKIIGEGWHANFGDPHAEVAAIQNVEKQGNNPEGSEVFVTLEPCCHKGKTPPCVDLLVKKKVAKVHILFRDENKKVNGMSIQKLQKYGIAVNENFPDLRKENEELYEDFFFSIQNKKPFARIKMAMDRNGFIASQKGIKTVITGKECEKYTHFLRQRCDTILVGVQTVITDDPHLGVRIGDFFQGARDPMRIILDPHVRAFQKSRVFRDKNFLLVIGDKNEAKAKHLFGNRVMIQRLNSEGTFDLQKLLRDLWKLNIGNVLVEGGVKTVREFLRQKCAQKGYVYTSPKSITETEGVRGIDFTTLPEFRVTAKRKLGADMMQEGVFVF